MTAGLDDLASLHKTAEPVLADILTARLVNEQVGGLWVTPFTVADLPEDFLAAVAGLAQVRQGTGQRSSFADNAFARARAANPHYRKY